MNIIKEIENIIYRHKITKVIKNFMYMLINLVIYISFPRDGQENRII
jgi:hypothetical protein